jgi:alpha-1,2-mannosyltransferase
VPARAADKTASRVAGSDAPLPEELLNRRPPIWLAAYTLILAIWLAGLYLPLFFASFPTPIDSLDFSNYYAGARIGLEHGWSRIYDLGLQQQAFYQLHPANDIFDWRRYFVSPPPVAWLVAPFSVLPLVPAFWIFAGVSAIAFGATGWLATPGRGIGRVALFLTAACVFPVLIAIQTGQITPLIAAATVLAWWLTRSGREVLAGVVLVAVALKPQVAVLVPAAMLIAGHRRLFVAWLAGASALVVVSLVSLGGDGLGQLQTALRMEQGQGANLAWTMAGLVGQGPQALGLELIGGALALSLAYWHRRRGLELVFVAGIVGTLVAAPYHNPSDFAVLAPATWLYLRIGVRPWQWAWLALGLVATYAAAGFGPDLLLIFVLGWLGLLIADTQTTGVAGGARIAARAGADLGSR